MMADTTCGALPEARRLELIEELADAGEGIGFFAQCLFHELTEEAIEALARQGIPAASGRERLDRGFARIGRYLLRSGEDRRSQLACEYARIFLAAGVYSQEKRTAVPYESVFVGEEHLVMGEARDDVVAWYAADGFMVEPALHEPEDHLAFELEYLAVLVDRAAAALAKGEDAAFAAQADRARAFIGAHLLNWLPELSEAVAEYAQASFYPGLIDVLIGTLEELSDELASAASEAGAVSGEAVEPVAAVREMRPAFDESAGRVLVGAGAMPGARIR